MILTYYLHYWHLFQGTVPTSLGRYKPVFNAAQEAELAAHCRDLDVRFYGLTRVSLRRLAFSFASANGCQATFNQQNQMAGKEWTSSFCERHGFSLRVPEKCSLGRAIGFNAVQVSWFFDNLKEVYGKHTYPPSRIYNMDETGVSTVPNKVPKVYAEKGKRAVSKVVSADRGQLVTAVCCISASGLYVPPALIFPRKRKKEELYREAPPGTLAMISDSGYMNTDLFVEWLEHFQVFVKSSQEDPVLLILDNHVSDCSLGAIDTSRKYNICLVSLPPHASHKLQPLGVGFFGPFKTAYSVECDNWMVGHPGRPITHKEVAGLFRAAYYRVGNLERPINAFKATGIYPFRPTIFEEVDFLPSDVTYRPLDEEVPGSIDQRACNSILVTCPHCDAWPGHHTCDSFGSTFAPDFAYSQRDARSLAHTCDPYTGDTSTGDHSACDPSTGNHSARDPSTGNHSACDTSTDSFGSPFAPDFAYSQRDARSLAHTCDPYTGDTSTGDHSACDPSTGDHPTSAPDVTWTVFVSCQPGPRNFFLHFDSVITINRVNLAPPTLPDGLVTGRWFFDVM